MWVDRRWGTEGCPHCLYSLVVSVPLSNVHLNSEVCLRRNNGQPSFIHTGYPIPWVVIEVFCVICRSIGLQAGVTGEQTPFYLKDFISSWWDRDRQESEGFSYCVIMWNVLEAPGRDGRRRRRRSESVLKATALSRVLQVSFHLDTELLGCLASSSGFSVFPFVTGSLWFAGLFWSLCYFCVILLNDWMKGEK